MKERKIPQRTCIGCSIKQEQGMMFRFVDNEEGIAIDLQGKKNGRGCYLCKKEECIEKAEKRKAFQRAFKRNVTSEEINALKEIVKKEVMRSET